MYVSKNRSVFVRPDVGGQVGLEDGAVGLDHGQGRSGRFVEGPKGGQALVPPQHQEKAFVERCRRLRIERGVPERQREAAIGGKSLARDEIERSLRLRRQPLDRIAVEGRHTAAAIVSGSTGVRVIVRRRSHRTSLPQLASSSFKAASSTAMSSGLVPGPPAKWPQKVSTKRSSALGMRRASMALSSGGK